MTTLAGRYMCVFAICIFSLLTYSSVCATCFDESEVDVKKIELIGIAEIAGTAKDKSGLTERFETKIVETIPVPVGQVPPAVPETRERILVTTHDMLGGISGLAYTGKDDIYYLLPDRGPADGAVDWNCRFQKMQIKIKPGAEEPVATQMVETVMFSDANGLSMTGLANAFPGYNPENVSMDENAKPLPLRFDPEGIRVGENGNVWISDEYGPRLIEFTEEGKFVREIDVPQHYQIKNPGLTKLDENPKNESGRQCNRGMEGLAILPDQKNLLGLMQSPLLQDSQRATLADKPMGLNCRMIGFSTDGKVEKEYVYQLDSVSTKLNEILAIDETTFITIERDGEIGSLAKFKKLMTGAKMTGQFTVDGKPLGDLKEESYEIAKVEKQPEGDLWVITARIKYEKRDFTVPVPIDVKWAGSTPVLTLDDLTLPGFGTFSARVLFHKDKYVGTWTHNDVGGHMFGKVDIKAEAANSSE